MKRAKVYFVCLISSVIIMLSPTLINLGFLSFGTYPPPFILSIIEPIMFMAGVVCTALFGMITIAMVWRND
jgi:hypothetical protein